MTKKRIISAILALLMIPASVCYGVDTLSGDEISVTAPSAILIERRTGAVIYEKEPDMKLFPASVTKIMTMLLIVEAIESGSFTEDSVVTASERAASFGGSCVYLEAGEQMTVRDMLKCIAVVSANDCAVAMAEYMSGTEERFVELMNRRAMELGMNSTRFRNCTGLFDEKEHYTTARDVAVMSRELLSHDMIKQYTTIWMDSIRGGEFELSSTNKLVYWYPGCTGLKTGYTERAKFCLSASAERDGVEYIAVVMAADSSDKRNSDAQRLLDYGFQNFRLCSLEGWPELPAVSVELGEKAVAGVEVKGEPWVLVPKSRGGEPEYAVELEKRVSAPVKRGDRLGTLTVTISGEEAASLPIIASETVEQLDFWGLCRKLAGGLVGI